MKKIINFCIIIVFPLLMVSSCYYIKQGSTLFSQHWSAKNVEDILKDPNTPQKVKDFILKTKKIKKFALDRLQLTNIEVYNSYVSIEQDYLANVVQACKDDEFTPYIWDYPFVGKMPYKGFYDVKDARSEAESLKSKNYDTIVRKVEAFSTLGFFKDPLYSFMVDYDDFRLAELIFHEMTHGVIFIKGDQTGFNEEFATFHGRLGALLYLIEEFGSESNEYKDAIAIHHDSEAYSNFLKRMAKDLDIVYTSKITREEKLLKKNEVIASWKQKYIDEYDTNFITPYYKKSLPENINNAWLELFRLYEGENTLYQEYYNSFFIDDLSGLIENIMYLSSKSNDVKMQMKVLLAEKK